MVAVFSGRSRASSRHYKPLWVVVGRKEDAAFSRQAPDVFSHSMLSGCSNVSFSTRFLSLFHVDVRPSVNNSQIRDNAVPLAAETPRGRRRVAFAGR